ncbi:hypothetical protein [Streptomyces sioyaensis]|uniref:hypothetical protein n=1 Tax=Streptomyces sioyaensis TaxID=67364 RepID=UPI0037ACEC24
MAGWLWFVRAAVPGGRATLVAADPLRGRLGYRVVAVGAGMAPTISGVFLRNLGGALAAQLTHQLAEQP